MMIGILVIAFALFLPVQAKAANIAATSCSNSNVVSAYNAASAGDTILIPSSSHLEIVLGQVV